jgi:hypothetical protein
LARLEKPVIVVVQEVFARAARVHANASGCPDLPILSYAHPPPGSDAGRQTFVDLAAGLCDSVVSALGK